MYHVIARMYRLGQWTEQQVRDAATLGLITAEQADEIIDADGHVGVLSTPT